MDNKKEIFGYQGIFFDDIVRKELIKLQKNGLNENIINMHVTFNYGRLYKFPENIVGKEVEVIIVGYGSDGLNSGFAVDYQMTSDSELVDLTLQLEFLYIKSGLEIVFVGIDPA